MMSVYMFPGQGSQKVGMGSEVFAEFPAYVEEANGILGCSVEELCIQGPQGRLSQTQYTQPALFVVCALMYLQKVQTSPKPDYVLGHSVGEYAALFSAGCFDFATGLQLVKKRGELMSQAQGGGMAAIISLSPEKISQLLLENHLDGVDIANYNSPTQIVISGIKVDIESAVRVLENEARMCIPLNVSGAFHSRYMLHARDEFAEFISQFQFSNTTIPVVSNVTARLYDQSNIANNLISQINSSVRWVESIEFLLNQGQSDFLEIGPGTVLTSLVRQIRQAQESRV